MSEYAEQTISVCFHQGLHLRPIQRVVTCVGQFQASVFIAFMTEKAAADSTLELLSLELLGQCELTISATGVDAVKAVQATCSLFRELETELQTVSLVRDMGL